MFFWSFAAQHSFNLTLNLYLSIRDRSHTSRVPSPHRAYILRHACAREPQSPCAAHVIGDRLFPARLVTPRAASSGKLIYRQRAAAAAAADPAQSRLLHPTLKILLYFFLFLIHSRPLGFFFKGISEQVGGFLRLISRWLSTANYL